MSGVNVAVHDRVAELTLDRPPLNVIDLEYAGALTAAIGALERGRGLVAVVVRARGRAFSAGVDVRDHLPDRGAEVIRAFDRACLALLELDAPVIARVQGAALGGGCELLLCCDVVLADATATFGFPEIRLGVFPPLAAIALPRLVGPRRAAELVLSGRTLDAAEAERVGLVSRVSTGDALDALLAETLATYRALSAEALHVAKRALRLARTQPTRAEVEAAEALYMNERLSAPDAIEGLTAFMEKRAPDWAKR